MIRKRSLAIFGVLLAAPLVQAAVYDWSGSGGDWDDDTNWVLVSGFCGGSGLCYPRNPTDDANFPVTETIGTVCLVTDTIDDITIGTDVTFDDCDAGDPVMTAGLLRIASHSDGPTTVTISGGALFQHTP